MMRLFIHRELQVLLVLLTRWNLVVNGAVDSYTPTEVKAIQAFRHLVQDGLTQTYMYEDKYLIRWLRARGLHLKDAEEMIRKNFIWRKENRMDEILREDWRRFEFQYPFHFNLRDYDGRPALSTRLGGINIRRLILNGQREQIRRYLLYGFEKAVQNVHKVSNETGKEFVGTHLLFNMAGYDIRTHSCLQCVSGWINLVNNYENNYPQCAETMIVVNTPRIFETLYTFIKPFTSPHSQKVLRLFGLNKAEWKAELVKLYPENQLTPEFGGTYISPSSTSNSNESIPILL